LAVSTWGGLVNAADLPEIIEPLHTKVSAPHDSAVVIGIEDYAFVPDVPHARQDAQAFYNFLAYTVGVPIERIRLHQDGASREIVLDSLEWAGKQTRSGGTVWVYFAGHGAASPSTRARMLLGDDVRQDMNSFEKRSISLDELRAATTPGGAQLITVLDTC